MLCSLLTKKQQETDTVVTQTETKAIEAPRLPNQTLCHKKTMTFQVSFHELSIHEIENVFV